MIKEKSFNIHLCKTYLQCISGFFSVCLQCSVQELYVVCRSLSAALCEVEAMKKWLTENSCSLLLSLFNEIPDLLSDVKQFKEALNETAVKLVILNNMNLFYRQHPNSTGTYRMHVHVCNYKKSLLLPKRCISK